MANYEKLERDIEQIIESLKGVCSQQGLGNAGGEERVITTVFLYKFLNDRFMYHINKFADEIGLDYMDVFANKNNSLNAFYDYYSNSVIFEYSDTIECLINDASKTGFYKLFDKALENISNNPRNALFNIESADGTKKPLFENIN